MADPRSRSDQRGAIIRVDSPDLRRMVAALERARPELRRNLKTGQTAFANRVARKARQLARWSRRIPKTIKVQGKGDFVQVIAGGPNAPHAPVFEAPSGTPVRHPVFGNRNVWVAQRPRRFIEPAWRSQLASADSDMGEAVDKTFRGIK